MELLKESAVWSERLTALRKAHPWLGAYPWQLCRYQKREYICRFREPIDRLVFMLDGNVSVSITPPHGHTHIITWASTDDLICGDVEVALGNTLASADLRSEESTLCLFLPIAPHLEALRADNSFLLYALGRLARQMVNQSVYTANNLLFPLENRMAAYILQFLGGDFFTVNLTHTAEMMGSSYRQLTRVMKGFLDRGLLRREGNGWQVVSRKGLELLSADIENTI